MLIANIVGVCLVGLIIWWFWLYRPEAARADEDDLVITVENGVYTPSHIRLAGGSPTALRFMRKDPSPCAEMLLIPGLEISETLPLNRMKTVTLPPLAAGDYDFHCQMQMYRGQIHVN